MSVQLIRFELPEMDEPSGDFRGTSVGRFLADAELEIQTFWDQWHRRPIEQYVACDFQHVWFGMQFLLSQNWMQGNTFCEWGCGFGVVTGMASLLGMNAVGIEAEPFLVERARRLLARSKIKADIWEGNFLPRGASQLAETQANHASLFHDVPSAYDEYDLDLDDFELVFAYPWPGEEHFLREVFARFARSGGFLFLYRGPNQLELYQKGPRS